MFNYLPEMEEKTVQFSRNWLQINPERKSYYFFFVLYIHCLFQEKYPSFM